jgi:phage/plasmid-associated DNA primase
MIGGKMDTDVEYISQLNTNQHIKKLEYFIGRFQTPSSCNYTNIINPGKKDGHYFLPFTDERIPLNNISFDIFCSENGSDVSVLEEHLADLIGKNNSSFMTPMEEFFALLEECRLENLVLRYCEKQYFKVPVKLKNLKPVPLDVFGDDLLDPLDSLDSLDSAPSLCHSATEQNSKLSEELSSDCSCIELDFDVYQKEPERVINDTHYYTLVHSISAILAEHLDFGNMPYPNGIVDKNGITTEVKIHVAILRKPEVVETTHSKYSKCWKDSFHIRFFVKVSKQYKKHLVDTINERGTLAVAFRNLPIINPFNEVLDPNSVSYPVMFLGSMKMKGKIPHQFYKLYSVEFSNWPSPAPLLTEVNDLNPIPNNAPPVKIVDPEDRRRRIIKHPRPKFKYNLCYELSVNYEAPYGLIKKREVQPKNELAELIRSQAERRKSNLVPYDELEETRSHVTDLTVRDYQAKYLQKILDILKPERAERFESWKSVVIILARENPDYKPLAVYFSQRCPRSWVKDGAAQLDSIWEWALQHPLSDSVAGDEEDPEGCRRISTLYAWAKEDNPVKYRELQDFNAFTKLQKMAFKFSGRLHESNFAEVLKVMYGDIFIVDENEFSTARGRDRRWYEFVFPEDQIYDAGCAYKYRWERYPDNLDKYISKKLPDYLKFIQAWVEEKCEESSSEEGAQKFYATVRKNLEESEASLGKATMIRNILSRCEIEFRQRGFLENLDKEPNVIGVGNGVLKLYPATEMIQRFHTIPISRTTRVPYVRERIDLNDPNWSTNHPNPYVRHLLIEIQRLFSGETDAFVYTMCYLASSLDGKKKNPLFFLWLGEGSNGKSFLLELHIKTLHSVVQGGYAAKINSAFFTKESKTQGGPDSEKMMLKHARFAYCSESQEGDVLQMGKIKEYTSETISGNEKHQTQDMFEANCHFVFCTNHDPRITGRDYGTWRRILVYYFKMKFVDRPDPENPYEYKCDVKLVNEVPYDVKYKQAYLSILTHFYEMYRDLYNCNLNNISKPTIDRETQKYKDEQDTIERYISQQVIKVGEVYPGTSDKVVDVSLSDLANKYSEWHRRKIGELNVPMKDIIKAFPQTRLRKFIQKRFNDDYLTQHRVLSVGEEYNTVANSPSDASTIQINDDAFDICERDDNISDNTIDINDLNNLDDLDDPDKINETEEIDEVGEIDELDRDDLD